MVPFEKALAPVPEVTQREGNTGSRSVVTIGEFRMPNKNPRSNNAFELTPGSALCRSAIGSVAGAGYRERYVSKVP